MGAAVGIGLGTALAVAFASDKESDGDDDAEDEGPDEIDPSDSAPAGEADTVGDAREDKLIPPRHHRASPPATPSKLRIGACAQSSNDCGTRLSRKLTWYY